MPDILQTILTFSPVLVVFVVFYFFMMKPEKKRQQQVLAMQSEVKKGDKILTIGGIFGIVDDVKDNVVTLVISSGARMKIERAAIKQVINE